jgi:hypothetical protein
VKEKKKIIIIINDDDDDEDEEGGRGVGYEPSLPAQLVCRIDPSVR